MQKGKSLVGIKLPLAFSFVFSDLGLTECRNPLEEPRKEKELGVMAACWGLTFMAIRVNAVGGSQLLGLGKLVTIDVNGDDARSSSRLAAHDNREANSSKAEDSTGRACFHLW